VGAGGRLRRYTRRASRILLGLVAFLLVLLIAVGLALETGWARRFGRDQVQEQLDAIFVGDVVLGEIASNPLRRLDLRDVRIDDASGRPAIAFDALVVEYSLAGALDNTVRVERVALDGLEVWTRVDDDGQWNLATLTHPGDPEDDEPEPPASEPSAWVVVVEQLNVVGQIHAPDESVHALAIAVSDVSAGASEVSLEALRVSLGDSKIELSPTRFSPPTGALDTAVDVAIVRAVVESFIGALPGPARTELSLAAKRNDDAAPFLIDLDVETGDGQRVTADLAVSPEVPKAAGTVALRGVDVQALAGIDVPSRLDTDIELDVAGADPADVAGTVSISAGGRLLGETIRRADVKVQADRGRFEVDVDARYAGVAADVDAAVRLEGDDVSIEDAKVELTIAELARAVGGRAPVAGRLALSAEARGRPDDIAGRIRLEGSGIAAAGMDIGDVLVSGRVGRQGERANVSKLVVKAAGASLRADAKLDGEAVSADIGRLDISVAEVARLIGFQGRAGGRVTLEGKASMAPGNRVRGDLRLDARGVRWGKLVSSANSTFSARLRRDQLVAELSATDAGQPLGKLSLKLDARTPRDVADGAAWARQGQRLLRSLELDWTGARIDKPTLARYGVDIDASAAVAVELDIADRGDEVRLAVDIDEASSEFLAAPSDVAVKAILADGALHIKGAVQTSGIGTVGLRARARAPAQWADGNAWAGAGPAWLQEAGLEAAVDLAGLQSFGVPGDVVGKTTIDVGIGSGARNVTGRVQLEATSGQYGGPFAVGLDLGLEPDRALAKVDLGLDGDRLATAELEAGAGTTPLLAGRTGAFSRAPVKGKVTAAGLKVPTLLALAGSDDVGATGALDLDIVLSGTASAPVVELDLGSRGVRVNEVAVPRLAAAVRATPEQVESRISATGLAIEANARIGEDSVPLEASLRAQAFELGWLAPLAAGIEGTLSGRVDVSGDATAPMAKGELRLTKLGLDPIGPVDALRDGDVVLQVDQTRGPRGQTRATKGAQGGLETRVKLAVDAKAGAGDLGLRANAVVDDAGLRTARASLSTEDLELRSAVAARLTTEVELAVDRSGAGAGRDASAGGGVLRGRVDIGDTLVVVDSSAGESDSLYETGALEDVVIVGPDGKVLGADGEPVDLEERRRARKQPAGPPQVVLDIKAPRTIQVFAPEGQLVVAADLTARAVPGFALEGTVLSDDGRVELFGRRYRLDRFRVGFAGNPAEPALDIRLSYDFSNFTMSIELSGTPDEPELTLSADPSIYDEPELLAFVLGAEPGASADDTSTLQEQASAAAAGLLAAQVQSAVKDRLPVDVLRLELSEDSATAAKVTVGKWLTRKLFLAFRHNFEAEDEENRQEVRVEYRLLRNLLLEGYFGDQNAAGIDLLWIRRF